jgi:biopolymer transport protein ExbD
MENRFQNCHEFVVALSNEHFEENWDMKDDLPSAIPEKKNNLFNEETIKNVKESIGELSSDKESNNRKRNLIYSVLGVCVIIIVLLLFFLPTKSNETGSNNYNLSTESNIKRKEDSIKEILMSEQSQIQRENERLKKEKERLEKELVEKEKLKQEKERQLEKEKNANSKNKSIQSKNGFTIISNQFDRSSYGTTRIDKVEVTDYYTVIYLTETLYSKNNWVSIDPGAYILDKSDYTRKSLLSVKNITFSPAKTYAQRDNDVIKFQLYFARIDDECDEIDFIESSSSSWKFYNIKLNR